MAAAELPSYRLMGVVNVTPDSFSDGGEYLAPQRAIAHGRELVVQGAAILDVGGESTRPGAEPVAAVEEIERVEPVVAALAATGAQISIDTSKAAVAEVALRAGATLVNDVTAFRGDGGMAGLVAASGAECCLMHMLGEPRTMQREARYDDVVSEVKAFLEQRLAFAVAEGVPEQRVLLDPGIGFGKTAVHNIELLARLGELVAIGRPLVIGTSRKTFLGRIAAAAAAAAAAGGTVPGGTVPGGTGSGGTGPGGTGPGGTGPAGTGTAPSLEDVEPLPPSQRLPGTIATNVLALVRGASVFRVHDVAPVRDALAAAAASLRGGWTESSAATRATS